MSSAEEILRRLEEAEEAARRRAEEAEAAIAATQSKRRQAEALAATQSALERRARELAAQADEAARAAEAVEADDGPEPGRAESSADGSGVASGPIAETSARIAKLRADLDRLRNERESWDRRAESLAAAEREARERARAEHERAREVAAERQAAEQTLAGLEPTDSEPAALTPITDAPITDAPITDAPITDTPIAAAPIAAAPMPAGSLAAEPVEAPSRPTALEDAVAPASSSQAERSAGDARSLENEAARDEAALRLELEGLSATLEASAARASRDGSGASTSSPTAEGLWREDEVAFAGAGEDANDADVWPDNAALREVEAREERARFEEQRAAHERERERREYLEAIAEAEARARQEEIWEESVQSTLEEDSQVDLESEEWERALAQDEELQRAAAELARLERALSKQNDPAADLFHESTRAEAERDAYEQAARSRAAFRTDSRSELGPDGASGASRGPTLGLYAEQDYAWEKQAVLGAKDRQTRRVEEHKRHRAAESAVRQAEAAQRAARVLEEPSRSARQAVLQNVLVYGLAAVVTGAVLFMVVGLLRSGAPATAPLPEAAAAPVSSSEISPPRPTDDDTPPVAMAPRPPREEAAPPQATTAEPPEPEASEDATSAPAIDLPLPRPSRSELDGPAPAWKRYAAASVNVGRRPLIAIVIDDMGMRPDLAAKVIELPPPLTVAFLPAAPRLERQVSNARRAGHEIIAHVPMEPQQAGPDPGPNYLGVEQNDEQLRARLRWNLDRIDGIVGINNHMGSLFTRRSSRMRLVMEELRGRTLLFLDSRTIGSSVGADMAAEAGIPHTARDIFLDNELGPGPIDLQLRRLEAVARENGSAVAIGHPHKETVEALARWIPAAKRRGFALVPLTQVVERQMQERNAVAAAQ